MAIPIQAGELDSGSFILFQDGSPVCWMHSQKVGGNGTERWYWRPPFGTPQNLGEQVEWTIQRDVFAAGELAAWKQLRAPMSTTHKIHTVDDDQP